MAGHSKWANIQHRKGAQDKKRSKIFQKISKEIQVAMKKGTDPDKNPSLRLIIEKAKAANMPKDNIEKLLSKGNKDTSDWKEVTFEGYGPGGVALLVECLTDNNNRTVANIKTIFNKRGGNLGTSGSVSYLFEMKGIIVLDSSEYDEEDIMMKVMELPILDFRNEGDVLIIETEPNKLLEVKDSLQKQDIKNFLTSEVSKLATSKVALNDEQANKLHKLIDALEDDDDVSQVHTNVE